MCNAKAQGRRKSADCLRSRRKLKRSVPKNLLYAVDKCRGDVVEDGKVGETVRKVIKEADEHDIVFICGSFYIMAEARKVLGYCDCTDPIA